MNHSKVIVYVGVFSIALLVAHLLSGAQTKFKKKSTFRKIGVKPCNYKQYNELQKKVDSTKEEHMKYMKLLHKWEHEKYLRLEKNYTEHMKKHKTHTHEKEENPELLQFKISKSQLHAKCHRKAPQKFQLVETKETLVTKVMKNVYNVVEKYLKTNKDNILTNRKYKTCAVVGNGGIILENPYNGYTIDQHDAVFRINEGPTAGFEKYVGSKTTFRVTYGPTCGGMSQAEYAHNICALSMDWPHEASIFEKKYLSWELVYKDQFQHWKAYKSFDKQTSKLHAEGNVSKPLQFALANINILKELKKAVSQWPTTGVVSIRLATEICDCVNIYGFSAGRLIKSSKPFKYHYYDQLYLPGYQETEKGEDKTNPHKYNKEGDWIVNLAKAGTINDMSFPADNKDWRK